MGMYVKKKYISLIEVIVTTAVILTLLSILASSIKSSRELTIRVQCLSNISQIRNYTEFFRKDYGKLPYSDKWLTDFSYAVEYLQGTKDLHVFTCPGSKDPEIKSTSDLTSKTSYLYLPRSKTMANNIQDGQNVGINLINLSDFLSKQDLVIYDKSPDHHRNYINIAFLFSGDEPPHANEGEIKTSNDLSKLLFFTAAGTLELENSPSLGGLDINPNLTNSSTFSIESTSGTTSEIRDQLDSEIGTTVKITIKVKSTGRTIVINGQEISLSPNSTYEISATANNSSQEPPYFIYELSQNIAGLGNWRLELYEGSGTLSIRQVSNGNTLSQ